MNTEPVSRKNSTVLGYRRGLWRHLRFDGYTQKDTSAWFRGRGCQYLHVAAHNPKHGPAPKITKNVKLWFERGGVLYRVRPWPELPGTKAVLIGGQWHWQFPTKARKS